MSNSELFAVEFPPQAEIEKALARVTSILRAFLPFPNGTDDRRVHHLPIVEAWLPRGTEAEQLAMATQRDEDEEKTADVLC